MINCYCDKCGILEAEYFFHANNEDTFDLDLCKKCMEKLFSWLKIGIELN